MRRPAQHVLVYSLSTRCCSYCEILGCLAGAALVQWRMVPEQNRAWFKTVGKSLQAMRPDRKTVQCVQQSALKNAIV